MKMVLDVPRAINSMIGDPSKPLFITEGIKKADAAASRGLSCIALLGVWNWRGTNEYGGLTALSEWEDIAFNGRDAYIVFDSDVMTKPAVYAALVRLKAFLEGRKAQVFVIYLPAGDGAGKCGLDDFFVAGNDVNDLLKRTTTTLIAPPNDGGTDATDTTATDQLLRFCETSQLYRTDRSVLCVRFPIATHYEVWPIRSSAFRNWLDYQFHQKYAKPPTNQAIDETLRILESRARFDGEERTLSVRLYQDKDGNIWYDLGDKEWCVLKITSSGWEIVAHPPALFLRHSIAAAQVEPVMTSETLPRRLEYLRQFVNVREASSWYLVIAWLVAAFFPDISHPVLVMHGEQGSAKSTLMGLLTKLIDPTRTTYRSEPNNKADWVQMADHSWLISLDNVSNLPAWLSDAMCRAVTGDADSRRQLYTDTEDVIFSFRRVIVLTGVEIPVWRADLLDRSILLALEPITPGQRRSETDVHENFERLRPVIFGALLDAVSGVIRELPNVGSHKLPRMAAFAQIGIALELVLGWSPGTFMNAYGGNIAEQNDEALFASSLGSRVVSFMEYNRKGYKDTAERLLAQLTSRLSRGVKPFDWPKSAHALSGQLRRLKPALRANGIEVEIGRDYKARFIKLSYTPIPTGLVGHSCDISDHSSHETGKDDAN